MVRQKRIIIKKKNDETLKEKLKNSVVQKSENEPMQSTGNEENQNILNIADLLTKAIETGIKKSAEEKTLNNNETIEKLTWQIEKLKINNDKLKDKIKELKAIIDENNMIEENATHNKLNIAITRYRTKFMEHSHAKIQWNKQKTKLTNIIEELKSELVKYAPNNEIFEVVEKMLEITNENHIARKKSLKPEDE